MTYVSRWMVKLIRRITLLMSISRCERTPLLFFTVRSGANMIKFPDLYCVGFVCDALRKRISNSLTVRDAARRFRYRSWSSQWCPRRESRPIPSPGVRCIVLQIKEIASIICLSRVRTNDIMDVKPILNDVLKLTMHASEMSQKISII